MAINETFATNVPSVALYGNWLVATNATSALRVTDAAAVGM
jgi:hypothetical protein